MFEQLVNPNFAAVGYIGECEAYAEAFFGVTLEEPTARAAWDAAQFKHPGEEPPAGVIVPMFWDYLNPEDGNNDGHVAGSLGDGRIQSSPWQQGTTHAVLPSRAELESIYSDNGTYPLTYLGWSEDISNVRIVKGEDVMDQDHVKALFEVYERRDPSPDELTQWVGKDATELIDVERSRPAYQDTVKFIQVGEKAVAEDWQGQIAELQKQLADLKVAPVPATDPSVTVTESGLWASFKKFLGL